MNLSPDFMLKILSKRENCDLISVIESVEVENSIGKHQSVLGEVFRVKVRSQLQNGRKKTCKLIVKNCEQDETQMHFEINRSYYSTEIKAYKILDNLKWICNYYSMKGDLPWADCLYSYCDSTSFTIVLQDLTELGYNEFQGQLLDKDHALLAVEGLAKVHAMSRLVIAAKQVPMELMNRQKIMFLKDYFYEGLTILAKAVCIWKDKWKYIGEYLLSIRENVVDVYENLYNELRNEFTVLNLGDVWTHNIMFKYSDVNLSPVSVKFLDFQFSHLNSFVWDLNYLLHVALMPYLRLEIYEQCLKRYHQVFQNTISFFDGDPLLAPSLHQIEVLMDKLILPGFLFSSLSTAELISAEESDYKKNAGTDCLVKLEWFLKNAVQNGFIKNIEYFEDKDLFNKSNLNV